jgi:hypothetical protein
MLTVWIHTTWTLFLSNLSFLCILEKATVTRTHTHIKSDTFQRMKSMSNGTQTSEAYRHASGKGERKYSFYSFLTSALDGGEWSALCPGPRFTPNIHWIWRFWASELIWTQTLEKKFFASAGDRTRSSSLKSAVVTQLSEVAGYELDDQRRFSTRTNMLCSSQRPYRVFVLTCPLMHFVLGTLTGG